VTERSWVWVALVGDAPDDATAAAPARERGEAAGWLALWAQRRKPARHALRADARLLDAEGAPAVVSLVLPPDGVRVPVDDLAVQQARRRVLAEPPADAVSLLLRDASHFEGSITVYRDGRAQSDPFARLFPARILEIGADALGTAPPPPGPVIERYGSANPWPWDRYG
jgi:hypothetical protein